MTDLPKPQPGVDDLTGLIPAVIADDDADPELVTIGERYWALAGFAPEYGTPVWCEKTKDIDTAGWGHQVYAVAAAGVRAVVPNRQCHACGGPLSLTSRTAFQQVCNGIDPACVECTDSLLLAVRTVLDPARKTKRDAAQARTQAQRVLDAAAARWQQLQQEIIAERYAANFPSTATPPASAAVREMVAALTLLRYAPSTSPIAEISAWPDPLYPDSGKVSTLLATLMRAGLLKVHPTTAVTAFVWEPKTFDDALRASNGDLDAVPAPQLTNSFYPLMARYYAPTGPARPGQWKTSTPISPRSWTRSA